MTSVPVEAEGTSSSGPADWLARASAGLGRLDLRNTWQVAAGSVFIPLGVIVILFAWYGSAHTPYIQQQVPYLVSGSFIGLGLMVIGALFYWAHWLYRIYDQADLHQVEQARRDQQILELLERLTGSGGVVAAGAAGSRAAPGREASANSGRTELVATASGSNFHRPDCPIAARHPAGLRRLSTAEAGAMSPCRICQPDPAG